MGRWGFRFIVIAFSLAGLSACATQPHLAAPNFKRVEGATRILLLPLDVELAELTAGGLAEPHAEWTNAAASHLTRAIREELAPMAAALVEYVPPGDNAPEAALIEDLNALHGAVGKAVALHLYLEPLRLPTKNGRLDWSLGPEVKALKRHANADYALFVHVRDSYTSAGRAAVIAVAALFGVAVQGGVQTGLTSLVDLETGDVVWFNRLVRGNGDLRTYEPARETARTLLSGLPK